MAFFDKLNAMAKSAGDKAGELIEIGKLNSRISAERDKIIGLQRQIGEYYFAKQQAGEALDPEAAALCDQICQANAQIAALETEITKIKVARATQPAPAAPAPERVCPGCGKPVAAGVKFCPACGCAVAPAGLKEKACPGCGRPVPEGVKFCPACGCKMEGEEAPQ